MPRDASSFGVLGTKMTTQTADYLVIGSGIAGLTFALEVANHGTVTILTKDRLPESSSSYAQGGIASVWSADDSFAAHSADTVKTGAGLSHADAVDAVVREGPDRIRHLIALGARFDTQPGAGETYDLGREGGHSHRRILHASDATGREIIRALSEAVRDHPNIRVLENHLAIDLLVDTKFDKRVIHPTCWGAYALDRKSNSVATFGARATMLCTGGAGKVYLYTSNPDVATGDGVAMAYRAGVQIGNMEFIQFHPTCLYHPAAKSFLITEAMRGEGAVLRRPDGTAFMRSYHPDADLAPRDTVARAIDNEMKVHGFECVYLDISDRSASWVHTRFPNIHERCLSFGIDIAAQPIPVVPAAHYCCGGVVADMQGATSIAGLYAAGEVAMTGLHGANRLASNSLLEALVFAHRAALHATSRGYSAVERLPPLPAWDPGPAVASDDAVVVTQNWDEIRRFLWSYVGIVRSNRRLARAEARITLLQEEIREYYWNFLLTSDLIELRNIAMVAELIIRSAMFRRESRGLHYNIDYPDTVAAHAHDTILVPAEMAPLRARGSGLRRHAG